METKTNIVITKKANPARHWDDQIILYTGKMTDKEASQKAQELANQLQEETRWEYDWLGSPLGTGNGHYYRPKN